MAYTVLARKYRSQSFDDIIGQDPVAKTLKNAIKTHRVAHAYLFTGTRGVGKTTMARIMAKALNCLSFDEPVTEPCCKCESCIAVNLGEDIDVLEIDGASNNGVEEVRKLRENAIYRPARARFKIYIIDEVHMLSNSAFNALLKILEEPPSHVKFIFATTEPNKVIPTIQSRCQRFDFSNISPPVIAKQLQYVLEQEKIKYEQDFIFPLARMANGSMRDGLSLLDRLISTGAEPLTVALFEEFLGCANSEKLRNLVAEIGARDAAKTLQAIEDLLSSGVTEIQVVDSLIDYMRDLMVIKSAGADTDILILSSEQRKDAGELAEKFDIAGLVYSITTLEKLRWTIKNTDTARALLEASLLRFALSEHFLNVDELLSGTRPKANIPVKKNAQVNYKTTGQLSTNQIKPADEKAFESSHLSDLSSIKSNWQNILKIIKNKLGNGTVGLLAPAEPVRFEDNFLTLSFDASARMSKKMCESKGRLEQIESVLSEHFPKPVKLKLELRTGNDQPAPAETEKDKTSTQKSNELVNDPAVKTVLTGLGATITGIEQDQ
jgi:DNA polymerase-3 subunit gamma/tau